MKTDIKEILERCLIGQLEEGKDSKSWWDNLKKDKKKKVCQILGLNIKNMKKNYNELGLASSDEIDAYFKKYNGEVK